MIKETGPVKKAVAIVFAVALLLVTGLTLTSYLKQNSLRSLFSGSAESGYTSALWNHNRFIDLSGWMAGKLRINSLYSNMDMYVTNNGYIVSAADETSTDYEVEQTVALRDFLAENGIQLLYVNQPTKYLDDELFLNEFGLECYSNRNADRFVERIREAGIPVVDLRESIDAEGLNIYDMFYRTDHHWTVPTGLWAAGKIAEGLNDSCGYHIDTSLYDESRFIRTDWEQCWLGEQGRKIGQTYVGLDDYTELKPSYETSYTFYDDNWSPYTGTFDEFINSSIRTPENDVYENISWYYSFAWRQCSNNNVEGGKILVLGDSYAHSMVPFLTLGVHKADLLSLRDCADDFALRDFILTNDYDTVVIAYAQFMIGAHDDPDSSNYMLFSFDR